MHSNCCACNYHILQLADYDLNLCRMAAVNNVILESGTAQESKYNYIYLYIIILYILGDEDQFPTKCIKI